MLVCEAPIKQGPRKGEQAQGTGAGYQRHRTSGEPPCAACKAGVAASRRAWRSENADHYKAWDKNRRLREAEKRAERERRRRVVHAKTMRAKDRKRRAANPEYNRARYWANPDKSREKSRRRRALKAAAPTISFTVAELDARLSMFAGCWMCGGEADTVDHVIPLVRGGWHCLSNLRPACGSCNSSKGERDWGAVA